MCFLTYFRLMLTRSIFTVILSALFSFSVTQAEDRKLNLTGNLMQGGLVFGQVGPDSKVQFEGRWVRVSPIGEFILGFGRDFPDHVDLNIYSADESKSVYKLKIEPREYNIQQINGLPDKKVTPDENSLERIRTEQQTITQARNRDDARQDYSSGFIWPVRGPITGVYGSQRILNGHPRQPHYGIDIAAPTGTPVKAPASGVVTYANEDMYFSGGTLVVDHGHNLSSSFLHLHKIVVKVGDAVEQGQVIALVGATGRVTGAHLDWRMNWHGQRIDPGLIMGALPQSK